MCLSEVGQPLVAQQRQVGGLRRGSRAAQQRHQRRRCDAALETRQPLCTRSRFDSGERAQQGRRNDASWRYVHRKGACSAAVVTHCRLSLAPQRAPHLHARIRRSQGPNAARWRAQRACRQLQLARRACHRLLGAGAPLGRRGRLLWTGPFYHDTRCETSEQRPEPQEDPKCWNC